MNVRISAPSDSQVQLVLNNCITLYNYSSISDMVIERSDSESYIEIQIPFVPIHHSIHIFEGAEDASVEVIHNGTLQIFTIEVEMTIDGQDQFMTYPDLLMSTQFLLDEAGILMNEQESDGSISSSSWGSIDAIIGLGDFTNTNQVDGELVQCPICLNEFAQMCIMRCNHSVCAECRDKLIEYQSEVCPVCRATISQPDPESDDCA